MPQEIELKLEIDPANILLLLEDPRFAAAEMQSANQVTIYYDTSETALKKNGFTLRVREVGGRFIQTVKPSTNAVGLISRDEIEYELIGPEPDIERLGNHPIRALVEGHDLVPLIRSDVTRTSKIFELGGSRIRLDLDRGVIGAGNRSDEFAEVELELIDGTPTSLIMAARRLSDDVPVRLGVLTKAERGFRLADGEQDKIHKAGRVEVHEGMTIAEAFEIIVHACLKHYRLNEPLVIRRGKPEALHQARVAMRRLRSAFGLFKPAVEDVEFQHLRHELRWFSSQLGDARNLDVYLKRDLGAEERAKIMHERDRAYDHVADTMNSHRFRRLLIDIVGWAAVGSWRSTKPASRSVVSFANLRLDRFWRTIATAGRHIADMDEATRHSLRIQIKKIRYAVEFLRGLYPNAKQLEKRFAVAIEELQEELGKLNDLATARNIGSDQREGGWLIGSYEERRHLKSADEAYASLLGVGSFWRLTEAKTSEAPQAPCRQD